MHYAKMSSFGDCALGLAPAPPKDGTRGRPNRWQRRLYREHPMCTERMSRSPRVRMEGWRQLKLGTAMVRNRSGEENTHVFLRPERLAMAGCGGRQGSLW